MSSAEVTAYIYLFICFFINLDKTANKFFTSYVTDFLKILISLLANEQFPLCS
jgi:sorbitol-specific phosphotransferase system component IIC